MAAGVFSQVQADHAFGRSDQSLAVTGPVVAAPVHVSVTRWGSGRATMGP